ncbi:hypothetical protein IAT40_007815 [Kwoniella sp. CBS 6097]
MSDREGEGERVVQGPRAYRTGLGLPPAVIIRSEPGPSPTRLRHYDQNEAQYPSDDQSQTNAEPGPSFRPAQNAPYVPPHSISRETVWKEWNTNPALHGPSRIRLPPAFVASSNVYDELGRTVDDGVGVVVDKGKEKATEGEEGKIDGDGVRGWYLSLSRNGSVSGSGKSTPKDGIGDTAVSRAGEAPEKIGSGRVDGTSRIKDMRRSATLSGTGSGVASSVTIIDLTGDDDDEGEEESGPHTKDQTQNSASFTAAIPPTSPITSDQNTEVTIPTSASFTNSTSGISPKIRIHSNEWFIRRALLRQSQCQNDNATSTSSGVSSRPKKPSSIGDMLNMLSSSASKQRLFEPQYALGPENKGYSLLKDRLGWEGGGLGRPVGWADGASSASGYEEGDGQIQHTAQAAQGEEDQDLVEVGVKAETGGRGQLPVPIELDQNGQAVVDLTLSDPDSDTGSDSGSDFDMNSNEPDPDKYGPGRTAPISTTLKLDRLGLGHRKSQANPNHPTSSKAKKITHSHLDIQNAQRRAKYGTGKGHGSGLDLGKKGKIKWKEKDKRERDERRRLAAALNG